MGFDGLTFLAFLAGVFTGASIACLSIGAVLRWSNSTLISNPAPESTQKFKPHYPDMQKAAQFHRERGAFPMKGNVIRKEDE